MTYEVVDKKGKVWGVGQTFDEAHRDAIRNLTEPYISSAKDVPYWLRNRDLWGAGYVTRSVSVKRTERSQKIEAPSRSR